MTTTTSTLHASPASQARQARASAAATTASARTTRVTRATTACDATTPASPATREKIARALDHACRRQERRRKASDRAWLALKWVEGPIFRVIEDETAPDPTPEQEQLYAERRDAFMRASTLHIQAIDMVKRLRDRLRDFDEHDSDHVYTADEIAALERNDPWTRMERNLPEFGGY